MKRLASYLLGSATEHNRYILGAYALGSQATMEMMESPIYALNWHEEPVQLGATPEETAAAAALWQSQQKKPAPAAKPAEPESGISIGGVALLVGAILVGLATWPRVSRWLG
jgi:hypothetical protein